MAGNKNSGRRGKSLEDHLRDGTYTASRHGHLRRTIPLRERILNRIGEKPTAPVRDGRKSQQKWIRSAADEHAVETGHRFNEARAEYVVNFFREFLCFSAGRWAGEPFELNEFQKRELIYPLFGWVREDGTRRFRTSYIEWPKKNYKSETAAGIGIYGLCGDGENGAEIYSLGADKDQARIVHNVAIVMVESSPELKDALNINRTTGNVSFPETNSYYRALSAAPKGKHGLKAHFGIADELHEWKGRSLWDSMRYAYRMRAEPIQFVITNAGDDIASVCYEQRTKAERIINGDVYDDRFFASIKSVTETEARAEIDAVAAGATEIPVATSCNPAMGDVINPLDFMQDIKDAIETPGEMNNLLRLSYGVWATGADKTFLERPSDWLKCEQEFEESDLYGRPCSAGLDLGHTDDFTALALWFPSFKDDEPDHVLAWHWAPHDRVHDPKHKYGDLLTGFEETARARFVLTPGDTVDETYVMAEIRRLHELFDVQCLIYDPKSAEQLTRWVSEGVIDSDGRTLVEGTGIERIQFAQNMKNYAEPSKKFQRMVAKQEVVHDGNPLLSWQVQHCSYIEDVDENRRPVKPTSKDDARKVDGVQAMVMALAGSMFSMRAETASPYAEAGGGVVLF